MSCKPRVSIGMPVYNGAALVGAALESILAQTFGDFELIISDNASTDATEEVCRGYAGKDRRIRYCRNDKNLGAAPNFNRLVGLATSGVPYFKWAAHDDVIAPTFLEKCVRVLDAAPPSVALVFPRRGYIDMAGHIIPSARREPTPSYHRISFARLLKVSPGHFPIFTWGVNRTEALKKTRLLGAYVMSDLVLAAELRLVGEYWEVPEELYFQRLHPPKKLRKGRVEAMYLNTASRRRVVMPALNLFWQHLGVIRRATVGWRQKLSCFGAMGGYVATRVSRLIGQGQFNRHFWDEARLVADGISLMLSPWKSQ
jgi:glycosyltransferase involved in cell wall biosynthesis